LFSVLSTDNNEINNLWVLCDSNDPREVRGMGGELWYQNKYDSNITLNGEPGTLKPLTYYISRFTFYETINYEC
jgi:hypothetical protein